MLPVQNKYGPWPASGEIDIMEHVGHSPGFVHGTIHTQSFNHVKRTEKSGVIKVETPFEQFHVYGVIWEPNQITWTLDGAPYFSVIREDGSNPMDWPFDHPFHLILNVAVGGTWGGQHGIDQEAFPATMVVDWVKVWQNQPKVAQTRSLLTRSGQCVTKKALTPSCP